MKFSTLNESQLHHAIKILYQELYEAETEIEQDGFVYDLITKEGNIIEIQTKNLSKLLPKIKKTIENGHQIKIVYPIPLTTYIEIKDQEGTIISKRKSPKKGCIYDIFRELTKLYTVIQNPNFKIEVLEIEMIEERIRTTEPVQSTNGRRRFKRNWIKNDKKLVSIINKRYFNSNQDYIDLLPKMNNIFCAKDLKNAIQEIDTIPKNSKIDAHLILWVLSHAKIIEQTKIINKTKYYKICNDIT